MSKNVMKYVGIIYRYSVIWNIMDIYNMNYDISDIGKSTGPRSSTNENSGGPMKTLIVPVLLSGKKFQ